MMSFGKNLLGDKSGRENARSCHSDPTLMGATNVQPRSQEIPYLITYGKMSQHQFKSRYAGSQCTSMSLAAVAWWSVLGKKAIFTSDDIQEAMNLGNFLHTMFREKLCVSSMDDGRVAIDDLPRSLELRLWDNPVRIDSELSSFCMTSRVEGCEGILPLIGFLQQRLEAHRGQPEAYLITIGHYSNALMFTVRNTWLLFDSHGRLMIGNTRSRDSGAVIEVRDLENVMKLIHVLRGHGEVCQILPVTFTVATITKQAKPFPTAAAMYPPAASSKDAVEEKMKSADVYDDKVNNLPKAGVTYAAVAKQRREVIDLGQGDVSKPGFMPSNVAKPRSEVVRDVQKSAVMYAAVTKQRRDDFNLKEGEIRKAAVTPTLVEKQKRVQVDLKQGMVPKVDVMPTPVAKQKRKKGKQRREVVGQRHGDNPKVEEEKKKRNKGQQRKGKLPLKQGGISEVAVTPTFKLKISKVALTPTPELKVSKVAVTPTTELKVSEVAVSPTRELKVSKVADTPVPVLKQKREELPQKQVVSKVAVNLAPLGKQRTEVVNKGLEDGREEESMYLSFIGGFGFDD